MVAETTRSRQSLEVKSSSRGEGDLFCHPTVQLVLYITNNSSRWEEDRAQLLMFGVRFYRMIYEFERLRMCALLIVCLRVMGGIEG